MSGLPFNLKPCMGILANGRMCGADGGRTVAISGGIAKCRRCGTETPISDRLLEGGLNLLRYQEVEQELRDRERETQ